MERMDPPPTAKSERSEDWRQRVNLLQQNPNEYYKVGNYSPGVATHIRRGSYKAFLPAEAAGWSDDTKETYMRQHWHVTTRKTDDGTRNDVFVKWLG